jgi:hypothetical protein
MMETSGMSGAMPMMEHPENTLAVPPLVSQQVLDQFCRAVQRYAEGAGCESEAAAKLRDLKAALTGLQNLAMLCRMAIVGMPHAFARVVDEMQCVAVDFPSDPLERCDGEFCEDEPDDRTQLVAAVDLFAGAAFISKDDPGRRDRLIIGIVRAIEDAIAFPVTFSAEAAAYLGVPASRLSPAYASVVIANAAQRLIASDQKCVPRPPVEICQRLRRLARQWMRGNPVTAFLDVLSGPKVHRIVHWKDPERGQPDDALVGDAVTLLLARRAGDAAGEADDDTCGADLRGLGVMFCPHQPAAVVGIVEDGLEVRVPPLACTGPIAVVRSAPDFMPVCKLLAEFAVQYPAEMAASVFARVRMDTWCYPFAFGRPILEVKQMPTDATFAIFAKTGLLARDASVAVGDTVAIHYRVKPPGSEVNAPLSVNAPGGTVTAGARPGLLLYRPTAPGNTPVELSWGKLKVAVPVNVKAATRG